MRQIILDTETTGLSVEQGHRLIEIGCIEMINRRLTGQTFHCYLNPERLVDPEALAIHGLSNEFLNDKPKFANIADQFIAFVNQAELIIHNAPFDIGFLNAELRNLGHPQTLDAITTITDTLILARQKHPGQSNNLDALCRRYQVNNSNRDLHGALVDAELLAHVYLRMTGGQVELFAKDQDSIVPQSTSTNMVVLNQCLPQQQLPTRVIPPTPEELQAHSQFLAAIKQANGGICLWDKQE